LRVVRKFESLASESPTLHSYLREIASFPALTQDDEQQLGRKIQEHGDEDALGRLVQSNLRMVVAYAKRFRRLGVPLLDLIHEGNLGLIEAARRFDPVKSSDFQTTALWWIRQAIMHLLAETGRTGEATDSGLLATASQGRHVDAIRIAFEYAQSAAGGAEVMEPPTDVDDFTAHLHERGRRKTLRKARKRRTADALALQVVRQHSVLRGYLN
jgi:RNA polymerase sigma factor (sigma-70 family)